MKRALAVAIIFVLILTTLSGGLYGGAVSKTIVVPDDYPTIAVAIENAFEGDTIFVKSGNYYETLLINKSISLIGESRGVTIVTAPNVTMGSTTIQITASNVGISNLSINNYNVLGVGIRDYGNGTQIVGNTVYGENAIYFTGPYATITENNLSGYFTSILCFSPYCSITNNNILNSHSYGIDIEDSLNLVSGNRITAQSGYGIFVKSDSNSIANNSISVLSGASNGISIFRGSFNSISGNSIANCGDSGLRLDRGVNNTIYSNVVTDCKNGIRIAFSNNNTIFQNSFLNNLQQASLLPNLFNYWDDGSKGNYWSDYLIKYPNATELDATGIGDTPYVIDANNTDHYPFIRQDMVPEFPSWTILPLFITATLIIAMAHFRKRKHYG